MNTAVSARPLVDVGLPPLDPARLISIVRHALAVARQRRQLTLLTERELADIGVTRADAAVESERPFWDLPANQEIG